MASGGNTEATGRLPSWPGAATLFYSGVKNLLICDSGQVVAGIRDYVLAKHRALRILTRIVAHIEATPLPAALMLLYGAVCFAGVHPWERDGDVVVAARRPNERRAINDLRRMVPDGKWNQLVFGWPATCVAVALRDLARARWRDWRRTMRVARRVMRRYNAFHAMRVVELLFYYRRYTDMFRDHRFRLAVVSSHSNPHGIALNLVARRFGVPAVLMTHGMPLRPMARLDWDVAIVESDVCREMYLREGWRMGQVIIKSVRRNYKPMTTSHSVDRLTIGILLSKDPNEDRVSECVTALLADERVKEILIRPHPVNLWRELADYAASLGETKIRLSTGGPPLVDLQRCDCVWAGNTTTHVEAVTAGTPSCYVRALDHGPYDELSLVQEGLIYELTDVFRFDPEEVARFYARAEWPRILRRHANVDQDEAEVARLVTAAVHRLIEHSTATAGKGDRS